MSKIGKIEKKTNTRYLNFYEMEAHFRDGHIAPYYVASRAKEVGCLKAVSRRNDPDGVILYGVYGEENDKVVLIRQYRFPLGGYVYEFPAGLVEPGEDMLEAGIREMYEETGLRFTPVEAGAYSRPFFTTVGMTDESCGTVFGYCSGIPTNDNQEGSEDIQVILADRAECRRILKEENVAIMCAYMLMHFIASEGDPLAFLNAEYFQENPMRIYDTITKRTPIHKGWSGDIKYHAVAADGNQYLLRISPLDRLDRKRREYDNMIEVARLGIPMCLPVEFGICPEGVYAIQSWIEGMDAEHPIMSMDADTQYRYGWDAGRILAKIHSIPAPADVPDWAIRFNAKIDRKIAMYESCELKYENGGAFLEYLAQNRHLLTSRPQTYQHGDYHIGNMMIDSHGNLMIIDFEKQDMGDPWEEFNRIVWSAQAAPAFASGMVDGYFGGTVPMDFWKLLALYISSNTLGSLPWAIPFGEKEIQVMRTQATQVLEWYQGMREVIPTWYQQTHG